MPNRDLLKEAHVQTYLEASSSFRQVAQKLGIFVNSPPLDFTDRLYLMDPQQVMSATAHFIFYRTLCEKLVEEQVESKETQYLWYAIHKLGWVPPSDLFSKIAPTDCIEVFDKNGVQVYRSFNFAKFTTYSLDEILNHPWHELYSRDESILAMMQAEASDVLSGKTTGPRLMKIPQHICAEAKSNSNWKTKVKFNYISPLHDRQGGIAGFLATCDLTRHRD